MAQEAPVSNPYNPPQETKHIQLEEIWRIDEDSEGPVLGLPTRVVWDQEGRIYVLDAQLDQVNLYSPDGQFLESRYRTGDGPGEIRNPVDLILFSDGSTGVLQEFPGKIVRLDNQGNPLPTVLVGGSQEKSGSALLMSGRAVSGQLYLAGGSRQKNENGEASMREFVSRFNLSGEEMRCHMEVQKPRRSHGSQLEEKDMINSSMLAWDVSPSGRVAVAIDWEKYLFLLTEPGGENTRLVAREYKPLRRSKEEIQLMESMTGGGQIKFAEYAPSIAIFQRGLQFRGDDELLVLSSRGKRDLPDGVLARYDVFDGQGHFKQWLEVECEGDPMSDRLIFLPGDKVIRIRRFVDALITSFGPGGLPATEEENVTPAVICYRIVK